TNETYEDSEGNRGQGPQQGDHDWSERHMTDGIVSEVVPGLDTPAFNVGNSPQDVIFDIATGADGAHRNAAPNTALAGNDGPKGEPGIPTPTSGEPNPPPTDPSFSPGPQKERKHVNDRQDVDTHDTYSAAHHDLAGNVNSEVDTKHLVHAA